MGKPYGGGIVLGGEGEKFSMPTERQLSGLAFIRGVLVCIISHSGTCSEQSFFVCECSNEMREKEDPGRNQMHIQYLQISSSSGSASRVVTVDSQATGSLVVGHLLRLRFVQETGEMD